MKKRAYYEVSELEEFGESVYSSIMYMMLEQAGLSSAVTDHAASHLGKAQGIISFLRTAFSTSVSASASASSPTSTSILHHRDPGLPLSLLARFNTSQNDLLDDPRIWSSEGVRSSVHELASVAYSHIVKSQEELSRDVPTNDTLQRLFLPLWVSRRYLDLLARLDFDLSRRELYRVERMLPLRLAWKLYFNHSSS